ncbi:hypothetical protein EWM64_g4186 [Hericium alpestre]|uniref:Fungal-type protein kinase domain-containing protein n=1 Tax=Hericium alpestre TaxID=135208 RepID=A0A4Z0A034_9AGAM|nr:hypothetical protein EWM64_g4186 [Hericium alpestre]
MASQFIGPMPLTQFFKDFVPSAPKPFPAPGNVFEDILDGPGKFEDRFIRAVERAKLCPTVQFVNSTDRPDTDLFYQTKVDMSGHRHPSSPESSPTSAIALPSLDHSDSERTSFLGKADWSIMEIGFEVKPKDAFQDPSPDLSPEARREHVFEVDADYARKIRGQMIAYSASHQAAQFRTCCFSVLIIMDEARLIRWDRAGAIVTEKFNYTQNADNLVEFLWRFNHMDAEDRGRDLTVSNALPEEIELAKNILPRGNMHKIVIHDNEDDQDHHLLISSATDWTLAATGRTTRGWKAFDMSTEKLVWLKDSWRIDMAEMEQEVAIYRDLNKLGINNVPTMLWGGDVVGQSTVTGDYVNEPWCCGKHEILKHQHCRLALDIIARKLQDFKSSKELCTVVNDAMKGMSLLAFDVPDYPNLGMVRVTAPAEARRNWRTGTWRFISIAILEQRGKLHELSDDLESFFHVLLYHSLRYRAASTGLKGLEDILHHLFDWSDVDTDGHVFGGDGKRATFASSKLFGADFARVLPAPLAQLINDIRGIFMIIYAQPGTPLSPTQEQREAAKSRIASYEFLRTVFTTRLAEDGWHLDDKAFDTMVTLNQGTKRKTSAGGSQISSSKKAKKSSDRSLLLNTGSLAKPPLPSLPETDL